MRASTDPHLNDDLLLTEEDRKLAASSFPAIVHVLDFPTLRELFAAYEAPANRSKSLLHQGGLWTIILGVIALIGASTEPLYGSLSPTFAAALIVISATAGLFSIIFGAFGVFSSRSKARWLEDRLMTERLRQFQFQALVFRIPTIVGNAATAELKDQFFKTRDRWLAKFQMEYKSHLSAKLKEILDDDADEQFALHDSDALEHVDGGPVLDDLFSAYKLLRIQYQLQYANFKLSTESLRLPRKQVSLLSGISLVCILTVFFAHFAISVSYVNELISFTFLKDWLAVVRSAPVHVLVIWTVIVALAARAFEEGLQPTRELERYQAYKARLERLLYHFNAASGIAQRVSVMMEVERLIYQDMRAFLKTNYAARFVL
jgi:nitrate reductase gamma subunit